MFLKMKGKELKNISSLRKVRIIDGECYAKGPVEIGQRELTFFLVYAKKTVNLAAAHPSLVFAVSQQILGGFCRRRYQYGSNT